MSPSTIELTIDEAAHLNLAMVGEATILADRIVPETVAAITDGQLEHKAVPKRTVSIPHSNSIFLLYVQIILPFALCNKLISMNV